MGDADHEAAIQASDDMPTASPAQQRPWHERNEARPYERRASEKWANELIASGGLEVDVTPESLTLQGLCPACGHQLDDFIPLDLGYAKRFREGLAKRVTYKPPECEELETVLACNCASEHKGRPEKTLGCGAYSGVRIQLERGRRVRWSYKIPQRSRVRIRSLRARSTEKRWDDAAGEVEEGMLARTRDVGTKWAATVATLLGLSGVATLLEARDEIDQLKEPLWANLGVVAGSLLALLATLSAAYAAQGFLRRVPFVTGGSLRRRTRHSVQRALWGLRVSVVATVLSALFVIGGLGWLAFGPEKPPSEKVLVETRDGRPACGDLRGGPRGVIAVERAGGDTTLLRFDQVEAIKPVPKC